MEPARRRRLSVECKNRDPLRLRHLFRRCAIFRQLGLRGRRVLEGARDKSSARVRARRSPTSHYKRVSPLPIRHAGPCGSSPSAARPHPSTNILQPTSNIRLYHRIRDVYWNCLP
jgi:hypothetical protein